MSTSFKRAVSRHFAKFSDWELATKSSKTKRTIFSLKEGLNKQKMQKEVGAGKIEEG